LTEGGGGSVLRGIGAALAGGVDGPGGAVAQPATRIATPIANGSVRARRCSPGVDRCMTVTENGSDRAQLAE